MKNWYAVYVNSKHEKKVTQNLLCQKIEAYIPIVKKQKQWSDRKKWIELPMLSGYVFVKIKLEEKFNILNHPSVLSFVKFSGIEARIKEEDIEILKSVEKTGFDVTTEVNGLKLNDEVEILQGYLKGYKGVLTQFDSEDYVQIQLPSLKQNLKVKVPKNILRIF
ncbi:MAG: UpxY family transcription antiterminator [Bacteroidota bacterium]